MILNTNPSSRRGFTLIELLVVVAVFMILALLVTNSLFSILKSNTKANLMKEIRQNGNYVLDVMDKTINGSTIEDSKCIGFSSSLEVKNPADGLITIFECTAGYFASNGIRLTSKAVIVESCNNVFLCEIVGAVDKKVTVSFTLKQLGASTRSEEIAQETFTKIIFLRNKK